VRYVFVSPYRLDLLPLANNSLVYYFVLVTNNFIHFGWLFYMLQTKEELLRVLGLQEEQGTSLEFLRRGYKVIIHPSSSSLFCIAIRISL
jgi:hypothetical protein